MQVKIGGCFFAHSTRAVEIGFELFELFAGLIMESGNE